MNNEFLEKAKKCKNAEEVIALAKKDGVELSNEELEKVNGGNIGAFMGVLGVIAGTEEKEDGKSEPNEDVIDKEKIEGSKMFDILLR